jgi:hypothetical protein
MTGRWANVVRAHREVAGAAVILVAVLALIDVFAIRDPRLLFSLGPLALVVVAAVTRLTPRVLGAWVAFFAVVALAMADWRYAGLSYPVVPLALARMLQWRQERR